MWWTIRREKMRKALLLPSSETHGQSVGSEEKSGGTFSEVTSFLSPPDRPSPLFSPLPSLPATLNFLCLFCSGLGCSAGLR